jgi:hypothetical protein
MAGSGDDDGSEAGLASAAPTASGDGNAEADGVALARGDGSVAGRAFAISGGLAGTGWIETYRPSQTIRLGAYRHGVKNPRNWPTVSDLPGRMSYP